MDALVYSSGWQVYWIEVHLLSRTRRVLDSFDVGAGASCLAQGWLDASLPHAADDVVDYLHTEVPVLTSRDKPV